MENPILVLGTNFVGDLAESYPVLGWLGVIAIAAILITAVVIEGGALFGEGNARKNNGKETMLFLSEEDVEKSRSTPILHKHRKHGYRKKKKMQPALPPKNYRYKKMVTYKHNRKTQPH